MVSSGPDAAGQTDAGRSSDSAAGTEAESATARLCRRGASLARPSAALPRPPRRQRIVDAAVALGFLLVAVRYSVSAPNAPAASVGATVLAALAATPLALRRRTPLAALWLQLACSTVLLLRRLPGGAVRDLPGYHGRPVQRGRLHPLP